tara:strand:+ start:1190 stop:1606 length:417 start_codon:yes stop_codon:yes gene_type:complete
VSETGGDSKIVIRFSPFLAERLLENAEDTYIDDQERGLASPRYGVSVLAGERRDGESEDETIARILSTTNLRGGRKIAIMSEVTLNEHGFQLVSDPNEREPMHHLVGDDPLTAPPRVDVLASLMQDRRSNPLYKEGTS